jgi:malate/lactate dehydrogenase
VKVTIVGGAGGVEASVAFNLLLLGGFDVVLVDPLDSRRA